MTSVPKQVKRPLAQDSARCVLLSSMLCELYAKYLSSNATEHAQCVVLPTQLGGFPSETIEFGNHLVYQRAALYKQNGVTSVVIFLDLTAAFYRALPEVVLGPPLADDDARVVLMGAPSSGTSRTTHPGPKPRSSTRGSAVAPQRHRRLACSHLFPSPPQ